jgi:hypothetical protein
VSEQAELFDGPQCRNHMELFNWARDCGTQTVNVQAVLWAICSRVDLKTMACHPSVAQIMADSKLGRTAVFNALAQLTLGGVLQRDSGKGRRNASTYHPLFGSVFNLEKVHGADSEKVRNTDALKGPQSEPKTPKRSAIRTEKVRNTDTEELPLKSNTPFTSPEAPPAAMAVAKEEGPMTREEIAARTQPTTDEANLDPIAGLPLGFDSMMELAVSLNGKLYGFDLAQVIHAYALNRQGADYHTFGKTEYARPLSKTNIRSDFSRFVSWAVMNPGPAGLVKAKAILRPKPKREAWELEVEAELEAEHAKRYEPK